MAYRVKKTYPHSLGLSACFRQWRAESHCQFFHGYALAFSLLFEADTLDHRNWVIDFGSLGGVKQYLQQQFDHKLLVAEDDPELGLITQLHDRRIADVEVLPAVGCEAFAEMVAKYTILLTSNQRPRVRLIEVECREHDGNAGYWIA